MNTRFIQEQIKTPSLAAAQLAQAELDALVSALARKDAALGMAVEALEFMLDKEVTCPQEARRRVAAAALAACRAELEGK